MNNIKDMYYSDLKKIAPISEEELQEIRIHFSENEKKAKMRLSEGLLHLVRTIADATEVEGPEYLDLIQEGNVALLNFINELKELPEDFTEKAKIEISRAIIDALNAEKAEKSGASMLAAKLNIIDEITKKYTEDHDEAPSAEKISQILSIPEEEVKYLLKIALAAVNKEEN